MKSIEQEKQEETNVYFINKTQIDANIRLINVLRVTLGYNRTKMSDFIIASQNILYWCLSLLPMQLNCFLKECHNFRRMGPRMWTEQGLWIKNIIITLLWTQVRGWLGSQKTQWGTRNCKQSIWYAQCSIEAGVTRLGTMKRWLQLRLVAMWCRSGRSEEKELVLHWENELLVL